MAVARVAPERAGAWPKAWFSITCHYRKPGTGTNRTSPRAPSRKCDRRAVTGSEQNRRAAHRWDAALSAERQQRATPQTKHHHTVTCTNAPVCISARSRGVFEPLAFPSPTSLSRLCAHLRAPVWRRRVLSDQRRGRTGQTAPLLLRPVLHKRRVRRRARG